MRKISCLKNFSSKKFSIKKKAVDDESIKKFLSPMNMNVRKMSCYEKITRF